MNKKKSIIIDLDVITVKVWDKKGENKKIADEFIKRINKKEFLVITPFSLLETIAKWGYSALKDDIEEFYIKNSKILSNKDVDKKIEELSIEDTKILKDLERKGIKGEDALLVLITSIFNLDYLIRFNRKHLRNKTKIINEVLKKYGLETIRIVGPEEI